MAEFAVLATGLGALLPKLTKLVQDEVVVNWKLDENIRTLRLRLNIATALVSQSRDTRPTMHSVRTWFATLEDKTREVQDFVKQLESDVVRVTKGHLINRSLVGRKIEAFQASFDDIYKWAKEIGFQPVEHLISISQSRDDLEIVGRDDIASYLVQTVSGDHRENLRVVVSRDVSNIEEARRARLCEKSNIRHLVLSWKNNEYERGDREYNDEDVMEGLEPHPNLKELTVQGFMGKKLASWITKMTNLVKITLEDCNMCEVLPPLPGLQILEIKDCPNMRKIPDRCCPSLKKLMIGNLESNMILETISRNVSSLTTLKLGGGKSCRSNSSSSNSPDMESIINALLENNSPSLSTFELIECKSVQQLTVGVALKDLWVYDCPKLMSINLDERSAGLKSLSIRKCSSSLLNMVSAQIQSSTLERLKLGPFLENSDEFPWPFSFSSNSFPKLYWLELFGRERVNSRKLWEQLELSTFTALGDVILHDFKEARALADSIANLPTLPNVQIL